jgi:hypothetical protein
MNSYEINKLNSEQLGYKARSENNQKKNNEHAKYKLRGKD